MAALVAIVWVVLFLSGAFHSDFSSNPDEPAHVVSGLMVRDYLVNAAPANPLSFAKNYYMHYPKVAIGHWPPLFYCGEAVWMLVFGRNRFAIVAFSAGIGALLVLSLFSWVRRECGAVPAFLAAGLFATCPLMNTTLFAVAPDALMTLFAFWAVVRWGRFLETRQRRDAVLALALAACALATHGRAMVLAIAFSLALVLTRAFFRRPLYWIPLVVVLVILAYVPAALGQSYDFTFSAVFVNTRVIPQAALSTLGLPLLLLALVGAPMFLRGGPRWSTMAALFFGGIILHAVVNVPFENRYMLGFVLPVVAFAAAGLASLWRLLRRPALQAVLAALLALFAARSVYTAQRKLDRGYHRFVASRPPGIDSKVYLVDGDAVDEGAFIVEIALSSARPTHFVLRGSKVLSQSNWLGTFYHMLFDTPEAVRGELDRLHTGFVVIEQASPKPEIPQLTDALRAVPAIWTPVAASSAPWNVSVFRRVGPMPTGPLQIDMQTSSGQHFQIREQDSP